VVEVIMSEAAAQGEFRLMVFITAKMDFLGERGIQAELEAAVLGRLILMVITAPITQVMEAVGVV
jgi:hypothetical protein